MVDAWELIRNLAALVGGIWVLVQLWHRVAPGFLAWWDRQALQQRMGAQRYTPEEISAATRYYVKPDCQNIDPAGAEDFRHQVTAREPLFGAVERIVTNPGEYKFVIFLADSGMGKTSFFLNYYAEQQRRWWKPRSHEPALVPLNRPEADEWIGKIEKPENTVLCLDALDEDRKAIEARISTLVSVLLTIGWTRTPLFMRA